MNHVNDFLKSYGITLPDGNAREQAILDGVYGVAEGLCLGVNPIALGAVKAIDILINKMTTKQYDHEFPTYIELRPWAKVTVKVVTFAACAGTLYAGGFAVPAVSRIAISVGLIVLQPTLSEKARKLGGDDVQALINLTAKGFTVSTLIGANPAVMIAVEIINHILKEVLGFSSFPRSGFSLRDQRLFSAVNIGWALNAPFLVRYTPMRVATIAMIVLVFGRDVAYTTTCAPWLQNYI